MPACWPVLGILNLLVRLQYQLLPELLSYTTLQISDLPAIPTPYIHVCALPLFLWKTLTDTASIENMEGSDICPIFSLGYIPVSRIARTKFMSYLKKYEAYCQYAFQKSYIYMYFQEQYMDIWIPGPTSTLGICDLFYFHQFVERYHLFIFSSLYFDEQ